MKSPRSVSGSDRTPHRDHRRRLLAGVTLSVAIAGVVAGLWPNVGTAAKGGKTIGFSASSYQVAEPEPNGTEPLPIGCTAAAGGAPSILRSSTGGTPTVTVATTGGTAIAGTDYTPLSTTATFPRSCTYGGVPLQLLDDEGTGESGETVQLTLSNPTNGYTLGAITTTTITIVEDANPPTPFGVSGTAVQGSGGAWDVNLSWSQGGSDSGRAVDQYIVQRSTTSGGPYGQVGSRLGTLSSTVTFTDNNVPSGTYYYRVEAVEDGVTAASAEASPVTVP
jgi:hypothetical protein